MNIKSELVDFIILKCGEKGLSLRKLSMSSGLSPSTVHNIIHRKYNPTISSLNALADYLNVRREVLWKKAGLIDDSPQLPEFCEYAKQKYPHMDKGLITLIDGLIKRGEILFPRGQLGGDGMKLS